MAASLAADALVVLHALFIVFVVAGGLLVLRRPMLAAIHLPCVLWGVFIEFTGGICPLTPLENRLRSIGGEAGYQGGFIDHYLLPLVYPPGLTPSVQFALGALVLLVNAGLYGYLVLRRARH